MKIEDHLRNINESLESIEFSIDKGIENHQRNIGFNCSLAAVEMLEVYLHKLELINPGAIIKHDWFRSLRLVNLRIPFDFPEKEKIILLLIKMEEKRDTLCYGKKQSLNFIEAYFNQYVKNHVLKHMACVLVLDHDPKCLFFLRTKVGRLRKEHFGHLEIKSILESKGLKWN